MFAHIDQKERKTIHKYLDYIARTRKSGDLKEHDNSASAIHERL